MTTGGIHVALLSLFFITFLIYMEMIIDFNMNIVVITGKLYFINFDTSFIPFILKLI
ncbi:hypothetical protein VCRA2110O318_280001 [Vibrio crassostreae]|nr:hypothetical protein VCRA2117O328_270058 [Vibrio crassostreae]CAK2311490.1 hypothetical protein VCRA2110O318_280001 [Vibrio crassostreae]CAK2463544.1 hypothetical protein VCRA2110O319_270056 [Vibrio crassostreae]CAK2865530.1 hypothetical protein VCRA217O317_300001 [Vibrio crassostreae]